MKKVAGRLRLELAQFRELEAFAQFASDLDPATRAQIERGSRLVEVLKQSQYEPIPVEHQIAILFTATNGYLDDVPVNKVGEFERALRQFLDTKEKGLLEQMRVKKDITPEVDALFKIAIEKFKKIWQP